VLLGCFAVVVVAVFDADCVNGLERGSPLPPDIKKRQCGCISDQGRRNNRA
jgi:hypothetical protein